jgi:lipid II:glycine glycyltransferase (peptidoglycan interpeptide bridge formation enzyme)
MQVREVTEKEKKAYDKVVSHVIQSWEWGEFRKQTGVEVVRLGEFEGNKLKNAYQFTIHSVPYMKQKIGYLPKGPMPNKVMVDSLSLIGKQKGIAYIKLEPDVEADKKLESRVESLGLVRAKRSLFTKYNFVLDISRSEEEILASMHPKTRYNIRLAQKKGVEVYDSVEDKDFEIYLKLYFETTKRQKYFGHTQNYHRLVWETLKKAGMARVMIAKYEKEPLVAWMLLNFKETLYYPYGGSSDLHRDVMASNLVAWEAIRLGKKLNLKSFDMWGALGPEPDTKDPWFGFHRFKAGYGAKHVEYIGSFDLVINPMYYQVLNAADKLRWAALRTIKR